MVESEARLRRQEADQQARIGGLRRANAGIDERITRLKAVRRGRQVLA
jgi:hypothetical protein